MLNKSIGIGKFGYLRFERQWIRMPSAPGSGQPRAKARGMAAMDAMKQERDCENNSEPPWAGVERGSGAGNVERDQAKGHNFTLDHSMTMSMSSGANPSPEHLSPISSPGNESVRVTRNE